MTGFDALKDKIERNRTRLGEIDRERLILVTQIEAYQDALNLMSDGENATTDGGSRSSRRTSASWTAALFPLIKGKGRVFSTDEILAEAKAHGFHPTRGNVRSQMSAYKTKGWIDGTGDGKFQATDEGRKQLLASDQLDDRLVWDAAAGIWTSGHTDPLVPEDEYAD